MSWINIQHLYMPGLHVLCERDDHRLPHNQLEEPISDIKLYLPSSVTSAANIVCDNRLCQLEWELRQAQAQDALHELVTVYIYDPMCTWTRIAFSGVNARTLGRVGLSIVLR
jgi:hypothetical protein